MRLLSVVLIVIAVCSGIAKADTYLTATDGNWNSSSTWTNNQIPGSGSSAFINHNIAMNVDVVQVSIYISTEKSLADDTNDLEIKGGDTLIVNGSLTVHDLTFDNGSYVFVSEGGSITVKGDFSNKNNSDEIEINGSVAVDGNFDNGNGGEITGAGTIQVDGIYTGTGSTFGYENENIPPNSTINGSGLPVELLYYNYTNYDESIILEWATATETNNDYFTIEISYDGEKYSKLGIVEGSGNSNSIITYSYTDIHPHTGLNYYRLKQTDFDGDYEYLSIIASTFHVTGIGSIVFANPVLNKESFPVTINTGGGKYIFTMTDLTGRIFFDKEVVLNKGTDEVMIPCYHGETGLFILSIKNKSENTENNYKVFIK